MNVKHIFSCAVLLAAAGTAGAQSHQYRLNGTLADDAGGPALVASGGTLSSTGYSFGANQGLTLNAALGGIYTIDMTFHFDTQRGWEKIIDFKNLSVDSGMYTQDNTWSFYPVGGFGATAAAGVDARLTLTRDAANMVRMYVNGSQVGSFADNSNLANFGGNAAMFFYDDHVTGGREAAGGYVDYIRTYDHALTAQQVANLAAVPEPETYALMLAGLGLLAAAARRRRA